LIAMPLALNRTSPTTLVITRRFTAPPVAVWDAHMKPALIRQWLCGDGGTTMPVCENDPRVGGRMHFEWREPDGSGFYLTGVYEVVEAPHRTVHVETMYLPEPMPENRIETRFDPEGTGTLLTLTMTLPDAASMDGLIASGMSGGMEGCYARLDGMAA
jgi:uncharacterized protein YndB with AHSA1/START domain